MGERVVRRLPWGLREQKPCLDGRAEIVGEWVGAVALARRLAQHGHRRHRSVVAVQDLCPGLAITQAPADGPEVSQAEAAAQDGRVAEGGPCRGRKPRGTTIDERPDRGGHESRSVSAEPPLAARLLEGACFAVSPCDLLDDEGHALRLRVHRRGRCGLDRATEDALQQLRRFGGAEPSGPQSSDEAHPFHVGHEVHRLCHGRELVRADGQEQEDRPLRVAPDDVPEEPEGVVVGPLDIVDEQRERLDARER